MTAPTASTRLTPTGIKLPDGYQSLITFSRDRDVSFWEKTVKPPGLDGGDAIDTTTMHNVLYRTFTSRSLQTMTDAATTVAYDPAVFSQILTNLVNQPGVVTVAYPDGSTLAFYGYLRSFEPNELSEGAQPEASVTITCTNQDPVTGAEEAAVLTSVAGT